VILAVMEQDLISQRAHNVKQGGIRISFKATSAQVARLVLPSHQSGQVFALIVLLGVTLRLFAAP